MKTLSAISIFVLLLASCSVHKVQGVNLNGTWTLNNVSIEGYDSTSSSNYKITLLDDVPLNCFNGSVWNLTNSGNGSYTIQSNDSLCQSGARQIYWSTPSSNGVNYFQVKRLQNGEKPKDVGEGYRMEITSATNNAFTLRAPANIGNQTANIIYSFSKQ